MTVLIVGAGPAGLATAACFKAEGVAFRLVDRRGVAGGAYREIYEKVQLASPARYVALPGLAYESAEEYTTAGAYRQYVERYAVRFGLAPEKKTVSAIERAGDGFSVVFEDGERFST